VLDHSRHTAVGPLHEGMRFATACHTKVAMRLAVLWAVVSSAAQSMLGRLPTKVFQADVVGEMAVKFRDQVEQCSRLEDSGSRICDLILGPTDDRVSLAVCLEEAIGQF
jgi:hypothetical protein